MSYNSSAPTTSRALQTDRYEITMIDAALHSGVANRKAVFEVFTRGLPPGRRYGVVAGTGRVIESICSFRFSEADVAYLETLGLSADALGWLADYRFNGNIWGYAEGDFYGAWSPVLTVQSTFAEAVVLETMILSTFNHDSAVAAAASRMVTAAGGRRTIEMGSRRTDPDAAVSAARAAAIGGIDATSNLEAGRRYGLETAGTAAHAFTMAHLDEATAFTSQIAAQGVATTLLVDTYDIPNGLHTAVEVARTFGATGPGGVRIDSGDLVAETHAARSLLDSLGAHSTRIVVSGDLDEYRISELVRAGAPIDVFGVGTSLVVGSGEPTASLTYKLVAIEDTGGSMQGVATRSAGKAGNAGCKYVERTIESDDPDDPPNARVVEHLTVGRNLDQSAVQVKFIERGEVVCESTVAMARERHRKARAQLLALGGLQLDRGNPAVVPSVDAANKWTAQ